MHIPDKELCGYRRGMVLRRRQHNRHVRVVEYMDKDYETYHIFYFYSEAQPHERLDRMVDVQGYY